MLEILIMAGVIGWFARTAKSQGRSGGLWGFIGAISFYGPVLFFGWLIYPALITGHITYYNQTQFLIFGVLLNIAVGVAGCLLARKFLLSNVNTKVSGDVRTHDGERVS
ncbi:MAG: hypothetical protein ABTQ26_18880 [Azonexus sp.]